MPPEQRLPGHARDCAGCHRPLYERTTAPNHAQAGFPTTCENCHRPTDANWNNGNFNHNQVYPLAGRHATAACATCHVNNVYRGTARDCVGCHRAQHDRTTAPNHAQAGFPTTCENCHRSSDTSWGNANFNHNQVFPLVGRHASTACATCHVNNVFRGTARDCVGCHRTRDDRTTSPNHAQAGFPTTCENCHRASDELVERRLLQPQPGVPAGRASRRRGVRGLSREQRLQGHGARVRRLPPHALRPHDDPNHAAAGGFSTSCESCHRATDTSGAA
ncbi:MAG: hypothetical protein R2708_26565 [Vicinamibacterales bacterium]